MFSNRKFCKLLLKSFHSCMRRAALRLHSLSMLSMEWPSASVVQHNSSGFSRVVCAHTWAVSVQPVALGFVGFCLMEDEKLPHAVVSSVESPAKSPCEHTIYHRTLRIHGWNITIQLNVRRLTYLFLFSSSAISCLCCLLVSKHKEISDGTLLFCSWKSSNRHWLH